MIKNTSALVDLSLSNEQSQAQQYKKTHQLDLQQIVELTDSIFKIAFASEVEADEIRKLNEMMSNLEKIDGMRQAITDIRNISCEMSCNLLEGKGSVANITSAMQGKLRKYSWHERVVLAIAAFASGIGELSVLAKHHHNHLMAEFVNIVKGHSREVDFNSLQRLGVIDAMRDVARTSLAFSNVTRKEALSKEVELSEKIIDTVLQISTTLSKREDIGGGTLTMLKTQLTNISAQLRLKLDAAAAKGSPNAYEDVERPIHTMGTLELIEKLKKYTEDYERLRNRHVLFLISDLDISIQEITALNELYQKDKYEMVWVPMVELSGNDKKAAARFTELRKMMKWIGVEPSNIEAEVIESIKKEWQFIRQAITVSVDGRGEITCLNALPMLWTWGNSAFPFTAEKERTLWKEIDEQNGWRLDLLFPQLMLPDDIDIDIHSWTKSEGTFVCLFGGGDMSWNQEFIQKLKYAAHAAGVSLKLVYLGVGKSKGKALARKELDRGIIVVESQSQWRFWTRLESILYSRTKLGKTDGIMLEALKLVGYGGNGEAWAMFSMGGSAMVTTSGKTALSIMENYKKWIKDNVGNRFFKGILEYKELITKDVHSCINVNLSVMGQVPGIMVCPECSKVMDMFYTYRCCAE